MGLRDTIGMMSTGALITLGVIYVFAPQALPSRGIAPAPVPLESPDALAVTSQPLDVAPQSQPPAVTRTTNDLDQISPIGQIDAIVSMSQAGLQRQQDLSPEQLEVIAFFESTARQMNQTNREKSADQVQFNNMAIDRLRVLYYYTVPARYDELDQNAVMMAQADLVTDTLCNGESIRTLMEDYGFSYTYTYVSSDLRKIGSVQADASICN